MVGGDSIASAAGALGKTLVGGTAATATPKRVAWFFVPNGVNMPNWTPTKVGPAFELPPTLVPLKNVQNYLTCYTGLTLDNGRAKGDGPGDHARSAASYLTGAHPFKTAGANIKLGVSIDQAIAQKVGSTTRFASLELGLDRGAKAGNCDSGYACAYVDNISWRSETTPMPKEMNPAALFDRMFGTGDKETVAAREKRMKTRKSILDFVADDTKRLETQLGAGDAQKLDEYQTAIREIELRIERARLEEKNLPKPDMARPDGVPSDMAEHMKLMCDLLWLAWRTDMTRVATLMVARDGSNRSYPFLGVKEGHHSVSHHGRDQAKIDAIKKIDLFHMELFAHFCERLKNTPEGSGNMLDNTLIMMGSGLGDGDRHNHDDLPIITVGKGGGMVTPGRHIKYERNTPLCNLFLSMMDGMGVKQERFADSTGKLSGLT